MWRYDYLGFKTVKTNMTDWVSSYVVNNSQGQVIQSVEYVVDVNGNQQPSQTSYAYGPFGTLYQKTDAQGNVSTFNANRLGGIYHQCDPDSGARMFLMNAFGDNETTQTPEYTTQVLYDSAGRQTTRTTGANVASYTWDTAANGIGKLGSTLSPDGVSTTFSYDGFGRLSGKTQQIGSESFSLGMAYDNFGRLAVLTYPQISNSTEPPFAVQYQRGAYGALQSVVNANNPETSYWTKIDSDATDQFAIEVFGNGAIESNTDSLTHPGRLGERVLSTLATPTVPLADIVYDYDGRGNITSRADFVLGNTETFAYDPMSRLHMWTWTAVTPISRRNTTTIRSATCLIMKNLQGYMADRNFKYDPTVAGPHQNLGDYAAGIYYTYDGNGRQRYSYGRTITYSEVDMPEFDLPTQVAGVYGVTANFQYDASQNRVSRTDTTGASYGASYIYIDDLYQRQTDGDTTHYFRVFALGKPVALVSYAAQNWQPSIYIHPDHLGSTEITTSSPDENGTVSVIDRVTYSPFGEAISPAPPQGSIYQWSSGPWTFAGQNNDPYLGSMPSGVECTTRSRPGF